MADIGRYTEQVALKIFVVQAKDKLKLAGQSLGQFFNSKLGRTCICRAIACRTKWPNLKLKTWPKQLLGSLLLAFAIPDLAYGLFHDLFSFFCNKKTGSSLGNCDESYINIFERRDAIHNFHLKMMAHIHVSKTGLHHPPDGVTNPKYKL